MSGTDGMGPTPSVPLGQSSATGRPRPRRRWMVPGLAAAVIVVVIIAALFASGTWSLGGANSPNPTYETFSQAESVADGGAGSVAGGPWFATFGGGVATPTAVLEPATNLSSVFTEFKCAVVWPGGEPANIVIPATPVTASAGTAAYWVIGLKNASNFLLVESVSDGVASATLEVSGGTCSEALGDLVSFTPAIVNSPAIVVAADGAGGSAFLAAHPNATRAWGVFGGAQFDFVQTTPEWYVEYTSCTIPTSVDEVGAVFNATIGGTSGAVIENASGPSNCELTLPTGFGVALHAVPSAAAARKAI